MNRLITKTGKTIVCSHGQTHDKACKSELGITLAKFIANGGVRFAIFRQNIAVECGKTPTTKQMNILRRLLRSNKVFALVTSFDKVYAIKTSFNRPIRSI